MDVDSLLRAVIDQSYQPYTLEEVRHEIEAGRSELFRGDQSVMVCRLSQHHDEITGHCWLAAGDMDELREVLAPRAEFWARMNGASYATIDGRKGWARALKDIGFEEVSVTLRKRL